MASELEEQKKLVLPYLQRAEEIAQVDAKVAYYCRLYAIDQGLKIPHRAKEIDGLLKALLAQLERDKAAITLDAANDKYACEAFALNIFKRADRVDRAGRADVNTSKAFYAASVFLEILNQFGDIDSDLFEKQRYSVWRAAEIRKAVREGRPPVAPPSAEAGGEQQQQQRQQQADGAGAPAPASAWDALPAAPAAAGTPRAAGCASSIPPAAGAPRFRPGSKVLVCPSGATPPEPGTVGKVTPAAAPGGDALVVVALRSQILELPESQLAPQLPDGTRVLHCPPGAAPTAASVLMSELDQWPPVYTLQRDDGQVVQALPAEVQLAQEQAPGGAAAPAPAYPSLHGQPQPSSQHQPQAPQATSSPAAAARPGPAASIAGPSVPSSSAIPPPPAAVPGYQPPLPAISEAHKAAKYAVSSLAFEDVASAVKYLHDALRLLTVPGAHK